MNQGGCVTCLSVVLIFTGMSLAQSKLTFRDVVSLQAPTDLTVSQDGKRVAFLLRDAEWKENKFRTHIWLLDVETGTKKQFTHGATGEGSPRFSPDGGYLAFTSTRPESANKKEAAKINQIWVIPMSGGESTGLTSQRHGISGYRWSSGGSTIFYTTRRSQEQNVETRRTRLREQGYDAVEVHKEPFITEIWQVNTDSRKEERIFEGMYGLAGMMPAPDGKRFAFTSNGTGDPKDAHLTDVWIYDTRSGKARRITTRMGAESNIVWSPDGKHILFSAGKDPEVGSSQVKLFMVSSNGGAAVNLTGDFDRSVSRPVFSRDGKKLFMTVAEGFNTHLYRMDLNSRSMIPVIREATDIANIEIAGRADRIVFTRQDSVSLPEIYISDLDANQERKLTDFSSQLSPYQIARQQVFSWTSPDGTRVEGMVIYPLGYESGQRVPLLVFIHGGPHYRIPNVLALEHQVYAARGYAVLYVNFRGTPGYGADFDAANIEDIGYGDRQDILAGVDKLIEMGVVDPSRTGVMGGSYGGYMTNMIISKTDRFKAAVSMFGMFSLVTDFSNSYIPRWELNYLRRFYWENPEIYRKHSPATDVENMTTPVLILHGQDDPNTVLANSKEMYTALRFLGRTVEFVTYPREKHGLRGEPVHIVDKHRRTIEWFDRHVLGKAQTIGPGQTAMANDWELKILGAASKPSFDRNEREREVVIAVGLHYIGSEQPDLSLDLVTEVVLELSEDSASPLGILSRFGVAESLLATPSIVLSRARSHALSIVFRVPADENRARLKLKEFPFVELEF